jgi:hypothetical protein
MKQFYKNVNFTPRTIEHIAVIGGIIDEYVAQGYRLTVRQLYYQLVARGIIENTMQSYKRTTGVVNDARMAGLLDWDAIEDRTREFIRRGRWGSGGEILGASRAPIPHGSLDRAGCARVHRRGKRGVGRRARTSRPRVRRPVVGRPRLSVGHRAARVRAVGCHQRATTTASARSSSTLGDHDPSGIDMSRDLIGAHRTFRRLRRFVSPHRVEHGSD